MASSRIRDAAGPPGAGEEAWLRAWIQDRGRQPGPDLRWVETTSGAWLAFGRDLVAKVHALRTDPAALAVRLAAADSAALRPWLVGPLTTQIGRCPGAERPVTLWPRVEVIAPDRDEDLPWADLGSQLAGLHVAGSHLATSRAGLPAHGAIARVRRALDRLSGRPGPFRDLGERLVREAEAATARHTGLAHGDWHLGQLTRMPDGWRLLDVDDLGLGDPVWDLGRPAGFWAAGLLPDAAWDRFLQGYRAGSGPALGATGDPWPALDLAARCAVFVAACREQARVDQGHSSPTAPALLSACARM